MEASEYLGTVEAMHSEARRRGLFFRTAEDGALRGRHLILGGEPVVSFASCSYLGLEQHPALVDGVCEAARRYGTQFSSSRGYVSAPGYDELEDLLSLLFGGHALVTPSTTLGHQIALPVLATEQDAIVLDHQVHHSVHMGATLARSGGAQVEIVRHSHLEQAAELVERLCRTKRTVWFALDGVFSMYGDLAPVGLLQELLSISDKVRLYVDDAHGMSWAGRNGRGSFLSRMPLTERMVLVTSLNKAFSAGGGCLVTHDLATRERLRLCGGPMVFSGPVQPPMLGAAIASARLHLSPEITRRQERLRMLVDRCNDRSTAAGRPPLVDNEAPIFFFPMGLPRVAMAVAERMMIDGHYVNVSMYPSVPMRRAGIRVALTSLHDPAAVDAMVDSLARRTEEVLLEEEVDRDELSGLFARAVPPESRRSPARVQGAAAIALLSPQGSEAAPTATPSRSAGPDQGAPLPDDTVPVELGAVPPPANTAPLRPLLLEHHRSIEQVDQETWDGLLGAVGSCSWHAMQTLEAVFSGRHLAEHNWDFHYLLVRNEAGEPVCATFFTVALAKDDMLMREEVSQAVELRRVDDPYFLSSTVVTMGSGFSEGNHLYLDKSGPWRQALRRVLEEARQLVEQFEATVLMLRDLPSDEPEMDAFFLDEGFVRIPMFDSHILTVDWADREEMMSRLSRRKRRHIRALLARRADFHREVWGVGSGRRLSEGLAQWCHSLYRAVAERKTRLNVFPLPHDLVAALATCPSWEIVTVHLDSEAEATSGLPVAWYAAHVRDGHYAPFFCGLDYDYVYSHGAYRQMILQVVERAEELGVHTVHMGMDADLEKARFGTRQQGNCVYVQASEHFNAGLLREIVAEVGLSEAASDAAGGAAPGRAGLVCPKAG